MFSKNFLQKGFTLTEMNVVVAIVALISTIVLFGYREFSDRLALSSAAQEISIAIRESQAYGISVMGTADSQSFENSYGIYFSILDNRNYYLFVDLNDDGKFQYSASCTGECISKIPIRDGVYISQICGASFGGSIACPVSASTRSIHARFTRPNPDAQIRFTDTNNNFIGNTYMTGRIVLTSLLGNTINVTIENTGQISINR